MSVTLPEQIACVRREIALRKSAYPKWVESRRMGQAKADREIEAMEAVLDTLEELFDGKNSGEETPVPLQGR